ncbi:MAG TPA: zinc ribbon domain-containing protein [Pyrinomonadaceae bacterium]|nr:zinc ribbon domain-containing protein [Pyrinomonadaceae bacterium]
MFCPRCGTNQSEELKFCKSCGANLSAVRQAVEARDAVEKFDWSNTWVAEMFLSAAEHKRRKDQFDRERGITPEVKRINEIKAGVIVSSVGIAVAVVLAVLMEGIVLSGKVPPGTAEILIRLWVAGVIPVLVGLALIINGLIVSKRLVEIANRGRESDLNSLEGDQDPLALRSADTNEFIPANISVTDQTTRHLRNSDPKQGTAAD